MYQYHLRLYGQGGRTGSDGKQDIWRFSLVAVVALSCKDARTLYPLVFNRMDTVAHASFEFRCNGLEMLSS